MRIRPHAVAAEVINKPMPTSLSSHVIKLNNAVLALEPLLATMHRWERELELLEAAARREFSFPPTDFTGVVQEVIERVLGRLTRDDRDRVLIKVAQSDLARREGLELWLRRSALPQEPDFRIVKIIRRHRVERRRGRQDPRNPPRLPDVERE